MKAPDSISVRAVAEPEGVPLIERPPDGLRLLTFFQVGFLSAFLGGETMWRCRTRRQSASDFLSRLLNVVPVLMRADHNERHET